jgi:hypothetical protein
MLTHYTRSADAIVNILRHGFAWFPNRRNLTDLLIPGHDFSKREPQQFGMISFTELEPREADEHRQEFGSYGIVVSPEWAGKNAALPVIYVYDAGPMTETLKALFKLGYEDVRSKIRYPDDGGWLMAYENKHAAASIAGSRLWAAMLQLWEYLEPFTNANQREFRIVHPDAYYSLSENKSEVIARVSPPMNWAKHLNVVPVMPQDVLAILCPPGQQTRLRESMPPDYVDVKIIEVGRPMPSAPILLAQTVGIGIALTTTTTLLSHGQLKVAFAAVCGLLLWAFTYWRHRT